MKNCKLLWDSTTIVMLYIIGSLKLHFNLADNHDIYCGSTEVYGGKAKTCEECPYKYGNASCSGQYCGFISYSQKSQTSHHCVRKGRRADYSSIFIKLGLLYYNIILDM